MTYIAPASKVLRHLDRVLGWQRGETPAPVTIEWDLSNRCVLGCQDCHFAHTHVKGPWATKSRFLPMAFESTGDLADTSLVRRGLEDAAEAGVQAIVWSGGGEPTTHPDWLSIIDYAAALGLEQGMYTLGGLLTGVTGSRLARAASWVVVSLDAADAETYAAEKGVPPSRFDAACHGIVSLIGHKAVIGVSYLLHAGNVHHAPEMVQLARSLGATYTTFRPAIRTRPDHPAECHDDRGWITDAMPMLERLARGPDVEIDPARFAAYRDWDGHGYRQCAGIQLNTTITPDGRVWICPQRRGVSVIGDLRQESFMDVWQRHPRTFTVDRGCRVMCRLHQVNATMDALSSPVLHEAFV